MSVWFTRWRGLAAYLGLCFACSWIPALVLSQLWSYGELPTVLRMLVASTMYALCMGWQPVVAVWIVRRWVDHEELDDVLNFGAPPYYALASMAPLVVLGCAMSLALLFGSHAPVFSEVKQAPPPSFEAMLVIAAAMSSACALVWMQALAEEVGWRGYFLLRFMQRLGPLWGLALHGALWGLWYAPLFLVANGGLGTTSLKSAAFVVTCMFLGALLGWLRLASRSVLTTTLANSVLTISAGLPFLLHGDDPGIRGAVYGPAGWVPMLLLIVAILASRYRDAVRLPERVRSSGSPFLAVWPATGRGLDQKLH